MNYSDLNMNSSIAKINALQCYDGLKIVVDEVKKYSGIIFWRNVSGTDYLVKSMVVAGKSGSQKSIGKRSPETEAFYEDFIRRQAEVKDRYNSLVEQQTMHARICKSLNIGRMPDITARIIRKISNYRELASKSIVVGTNAMFAYESAAGVQFLSGMIATGDIDILLDTRKIISIATLDPVGFLGALKSVDSSFNKIPRQPFRAQNKAGFMVDLIQPRLKDVMFSNQQSLTDFPEDLSIVEIKGLEWLVSCPKFKTTILDESGIPTTIIAPDPRAFAMHKLWISFLEDRNPDKIVRDRAQARAVFDLVNDRLSYLKFNHIDLKAIPFELRESAALDFGFKL